MPSFLNRLFGDANERELNKLRPPVAQINALEPEFERLSDEELKAKTAVLQGRHLAGESPDSLLPEAFAAVREAAKRTIGQRHFDVQFMGGMVLHQGKIAEMKTGEGKTLVATLPLYLNALEGKGAHLVTPNDYLSRIGGGWMGPIYHALGVTVGVIAHEYSALYDPTYNVPGVGDERLRHWRPCQRREAYLADITYGTNNEFGFDYLRDNMVWDLAQCVQRELHYAIVDEVDNILIDEARTPLIISGQPVAASQRYYEFARLVRGLRRGPDVEIDEKVRTVTLTDDGVYRLRSMGVNLPDFEHPEQENPEQAEIMHHLEQALKAQFIFSKDKDYVVKDGQVIIVDEFTGRMMLGRRWSDGLHEAVEAKEGVKIAEKTHTMATITFQNYFRMYHKLAGMTGTALTESEEFFKIYKLEVVVIPTNVPMIRENLPDLVYKTEEGKFQAVVKELEALYEAKRPVLVGTVSIEKSEYLASLLERHGIPHQVLNAKEHEKEATVITQAGRPGMVTIATNMAGRGVDILLGGNPEGLAGEALRRQGIDPVSVPTSEYMALVIEKKRFCDVDREQVLALGGLHVLGTERHEARRIDNQLRGRAGRQGDPGSSRFYISLEDELMRRFGGPGIAGIMDRLGMDEDMPIEANLVSRAIEQAQTKVEGYNFDLRKHVVEYDDVMNTQRGVIYSERRKILTAESLRDNILDMVSQQTDEIVETYAPGRYSEEWDAEGLARAVRDIVPTYIAPSEVRKVSRSELPERLHELVAQAYDSLEARVNALPIPDGEVFGVAFGKSLLGTTTKRPGDLMRQVEQMVLLSTIDRLWVEHLTVLDDLREGIGLRAYGQRDPLVEYKNEAYRMFQELTANIQRNVAQTIFHVGIARAERPTERRLTTNRGAAEREPVRVARQAGPPPAGIKLPKKALCWCGSGKRFEDCHGKKRKEQSRGAEEQGSRGAEEQGSKGAEGQGSKGAGEQGGKGAFTLAPQHPSTSAHAPGGKHKKAKKHRR
jgi:preprotein translocase subunit SecA